MILKLIYFNISCYPIFYSLFHHFVSSYSSVFFLSNISFSHQHFNSQCWNEILIEGDKESLRMIGKFKKHFQIFFNFHPNRTDEMKIKVNLTGDKYFSPYLMAHHSIFIQFNLSQFIRSTWLETKGKLIESSILKKQMAKLSIY